MTKGKKNQSYDVTCYNWLPLFPCRKDNSKEESGVETRGRHGDVEINTIKLYRAVLKLKIASQLVEINCNIWSEMQSAKLWTSVL